MGFFAPGPGIYGNYGQTPQTAGLDYIATNFMRSDTPTGIGTAAWSAPQQMWDGLINAIRQGVVVVNDPQAWEMLREKNPAYTPQSIGGAALSGPQPGAGGGGASGTDASLQDYYATITANAQAMQAAQLAYQDWVMRTGDDAQAFAQAQQTYENKWAEQMHAYQQQKDQWTLQQSAGFYEVNGQRVPTLAGIAQESGLTGMYQGKPTFAREQHESGVMQNLLQLGSTLRGPANYSQYLKTLGSTPQGMRDVVNAAAGRYTMPGTSGATPGASYDPATVQSLLKDVTTGAAGAQQEWSQALSGGLPAANQISTLNWGRMDPTQQSMLLSAYEGQGQDPSSVLHQIQQAAPTNIAGPKSGTYRF